MVAQPDKLDSGGRFINVDTRPGKKMKKRRELDALVGKTRRKNRGGHELLRNDSESSEIEEFSSQDSKMTVRNRRGGSFCGTCLTVLAFLLLLACIVACAGLVWVHLELKTELDTLRGRVQSVESKNDLPSQWEAIKSQVQDFNKSLTSLRTGEKGLDEVIKNLTAIGAQVKKMQSELDALKIELGKNPTESDKDTKSLEETVANMGSVVRTHTEFVKESDGKFKNLIEKVQQLEEKSSLVSIGVNPSVAPAALTLEEKAEFKQQLEELRQSAETTNISLSARLDQIDQELAAHQSHFDALESAAPTPHVLNTSAITESVKGQLIPFIQALVKNSSHSIPSTFDSTVLDAINSQVENISTAVLDLQQQIISSPVEATTDSETGIVSLKTWITTTDSKLESLDVTVSRLQNESDTLMNLYIQEKNSMVNLTNIVDGVRRYIDMQHTPAKNQTVDLTPETNTSSTAETPRVPTSTPIGDLSKPTKRDKRGAESDLNKELQDLFQ